MVKVLNELRVLIFDYMKSKNKTVPELHHVEKDVVPGINELLKTLNDKLKTYMFSVNIFGNTGSELPTFDILCYSKLDLKRSEKKTSVTGIIANGKYSDLITKILAEIKSEYDICGVCFSDIDNHSFYECKCGCAMCSDCVSKYPCVGCGQV